jgi:CubicO group peptidase (beta-lactamase class C family)
VKQALNMSPRDIGDGWELSTPEAEGLDPARVRGAYERVFSENEFYNALSLLVIRRGKLVAEGYVQRDSDVTRRSHVQSVTKSLTSLAFGSVWAAGTMPDLDASVADFVPVSDPAKRGITLRHLLTMRGDIAIDNDEFNVEVSMRERNNVTSWILSESLLATPGSEFNYRDCDPQLLAACILAASGRSVETLVTEEVFAPLGIRDYHWLHDADDEPTGPFGAWLRARDFAKLGELVHRGGLWQGVPVVPSAWLELATSEQSDVPQSGNTLGFSYGFYFWIVPELGGYATWGHGGNFTLVVPGEELVVVLTSMPDSDVTIGSELHDIVDLARQILGS